MAALWLALLLALVSGLTSLCLDPDPQEGPAFRNVRLDPRERRLSWELGAHVPADSQVLCRKDECTPVLARSRRFCTFTSLSLCNVTRLTVYLEDDPAQCSSIRFPDADPNRAAAATDLQCWVHGADTLSCSWVPGRAAPEDVQYRMFWRKAGNGRDRDEECPHYVRDVRGVNVRCDVNNVTQFRDLNVTQFRRLPLFMMTVNGTSQRDKVSCTDRSVDLQSVEVLNPPEVHAECNASHALLRWNVRSLFSQALRYQLSIWKNSSPLVNETTTEHSLLLLHPGTFTVQIRVRPRGSGGYSEWSARKQYVCDSAESRVLTVPLLVAVGTVLAALVMLLTCRRSSIRQRLCPPIPKVKGVLTQGGSFPDPEVTWLEANLPESPLEPEEVLRVEEKQ